MQLSRLVVAAATFACAFASAIPDARDSSKSDKEARPNIHNKTVPLDVERLSTEDFQTLAIASPGGIYMCENAHWQGHCEHLVSLKACNTIPNALHLKVSSIGPDKENSQCRIFRTGGCDDAYSPLELKYPGLDDLQFVSDGGQYWGDAAQSWVCYRG